MNNRINVPEAKQGLEQFMMCSDSLYTLPLLLTVRNIRCFIHTIS